MVWNEKIQPDVNKNGGRFGLLGQCRKASDFFCRIQNKTENDTLEDYYLIMQKNVTADMLSSMLSLRFNMLEVLLLASPRMQVGVLRESQRFLSQTSHF